MDLHGNLDKPTFSPRFKQMGGSKHGGSYVCHYIITDGAINFCSDSMTALAGQALPMPDLPGHLTD